MRDFFWMMPLSIITIAEGYEMHPHERCPREDFAYVGERESLIGLKDDRSWSLFPPSGVDCLVKMRGKGTP